MSGVMHRWIKRATQERYERRNTMKKEPPQGEAATDTKEILRMASVRVKLHSHLEMVTDMKEALII